jgi:hypothetical protein
VIAAAHRTVSAFVLIPIAVIAAMWIFTQRRKR